MTFKEKLLPVLVLTLLVLGVVDFKMSVPVGTQQAQVAGAYTGPGIDSITQGFKTGDTVTITGTNLSTMSRVTFTQNGTAVAYANINIGNVSATTLTFTAPSLSAGSYSVSVGGTSGQVVSQSNALPVTVVASPVSTPVATTTSASTTQPTTSVPTAPASSGTTNTTSIGNSTPVQATNPLNAYVAFTANTNSVASGATLSLQWNAKQAVSSVNSTNQFKSCVGTGFNTGSNVTGIVTLVAKTTNINTTQQFLLTCKTASGTVTKVLTITVTPPATFTFTATPSYLYAGKSTTVNFTIGPTFSACSMKDSVTGITKAISPLSQGGVYSNSRTGNVTLTCTTIQGMTTSKVITIAVLPSAVSNITVSNITARSMRLDWNRVPDAVGYAVYRDEKLVATTTQPFYQEKPVLIPDSDYGYDILPLGDFRSVPPALDLTVFALANPTPKSFFASITASMKLLLAQVLQIADNTQPQSTRNHETLHTATLPPIISIGNLKILAIVVGFSDIPAKNTETVGAVDSELFSTTPGVDSVANYYKEVSFGQLTISGEVAVNKASAGGQFLMGSNDNENLLSVGQNRNFLTNVDETVTRQGYDLSKYHLVIYVFPTFPSSLNPRDIGGSYIFDMVNGLIQLPPIGGEVKGGIWINGSQPNRVYEHEIGHALGLEHADGYSCNSYQSAFCSELAYADTREVMGSGNDFQFDPYRKDALKWLGGSNTEVKITKTNQGSFTVVGVEHPTTRLVSIQSGDFKYYFDYRDPTVGSFDKDIPADQLGTNIKVVVPTLADNKSFTPTDSYQLQAPRVNGKPYIMKDGDLLQREDNPWHVVQISHGQASSKIFVRFSEQVKNVKVQPVTGGKFTLSWDAVSSPAGTNVGYNLYRNNSLIKDMAQTRTFTDTPTGAGPYTYTVQAYDSFVELPGKQYPIEPMSRPVTVNMNTVDTVVSAPDTVSFYGTGQLPRVDVSGGLPQTKKLYWTSNTLGCEPVIATGFSSFTTSGSPNQSTGVDVTIDTLPKSFKIQCETASAIVQFTAPVSSYKGPTNSY